MLSAVDILKQEKKILSTLISKGFITDQNFPSIKDGKNDSQYLTNSNNNQTNLSIALDDNMPYCDIYDDLYKNRCFICKFIDGALIQLMYTFKQHKIHKHRLAFFSSPYLEKYQNEPELYSDNVMYSDILKKNIVAFPVRFDFENYDKEDSSHPKSHLTLGQYKNCRIPVTSPLTPLQFFDFILRNFYNSAYIEFGNEIFKDTDHFIKSITDDECKITHLCVQ